MSCLVVKLSVGYGSPSMHSFWLNLFMFLISELDTLLPFLLWGNLVLYQIGNNQPRPSTHDLHISTEYHQTSEEGGDIPRQDP